MAKSFVARATFVFGFVVLVSIAEDGDLKSPEGKPLTDEQFAALDGGKVLVHLEAVSGTAVKKATAVAIVDAAPESVFGVLTDYASFVHFMPYCRKVDVQKKEGDQTWVRFELDFRWPIGDRHYELCLTDTRETVDGKTVLTSRWTYVPDSGNINDTYGSWEVRPYKSGTSFVRYTVFTDPGGRVPGWAANMATDVAVPSVIEGLRKRHGNGN
jgi:hypothetical protein